MGTILMNRIDEEMIGLRQDAQIGKSCSRALEPPRHGTITFIKRIAKELRSFRQGAQIGESSSRALETPTHGINTCIPQLGVLQLSLRDSNCITKQAVGCHSRRAPRVPRGMLIWPGSSGIQSLVPQPQNVKNVKNVKTHLYFVDAARKVKCQTCQM